MNSRRVISCFFILLILVSESLKCFAATQTRYYRSDQHTVNGLFAFKLGTTNSSAYNVIDLIEMTGNGTCHYSSTVSIRHSNGTTTLLGSSIAMTFRNSNASGTQSATWNCPLTNLATTDAIQIQEIVDVDYGSQASEYFITEQLGWNRLESATWIFNRYTARVAGGSETEATTYFGSSSYITYISNITYTTYVDIGLRFRQSGQTVSIACEPAGTLTSPLRIRKGSTTYGIVLVDTTDSKASKIRIKTSSGIKALMLY